MRRLRSTRSYASNDPRTPNGVIPTNTAVPPVRTERMVSSTVRCRPMASKANSAPPPVASRTAARVSSSSSEATTPAVAPTEAARSNFSRRAVDRDDASPHPRAPRPSRSTARRRRGRRRPPSLPAGPRPSSRPRPRPSRRSTRSAPRLRGRSRPERARPRPRDDRRFAERARCPGREARPRRRRGAAASCRRAGDSTAPVSRSTPTVCPAGTRDTTGRARTS